MKELGLRALSGAVYVALVLGAAWLGTEATALLFLPITVMAALELRRLQWADASAAIPAIQTGALAVIAYGAWVSTIFFFPAPEFPKAIAVILLALLAFVVILLRSGRSDPATRFGHLLAVVVYITVPMACAVWMVAIDPMLFIGFMLLLWTNDTGAYLVGKSIGRNKLMPKVSPGKTWEGLLGGMALTALVAWSLITYGGVGPVKEWMIASVVVSITATIGDLLESAMKRAAGVKDSGKLLPGHGGALDRFDGYLLAAPAMLLVVHLLMAS
ncbi:MAG: phosphatidate cytidylyltransferase [Flavobacteriales bacterium]|nr:phosphatidate cytidylyltransferase [Flavobacteriales bacterium]MCC6939433.1 phosphatidate cytidylyltransferase [Flavobacteriales bacterium]